MSKEINLFYITNLTWINSYSFFPFLSSKRQPGGEFTVTFHNTLASQEEKMSEQKTAAFVVINNLDITLRLVHPPLTDRNLENMICAACIESWTSPAATIMLYEPYGSGIDTDAMHVMYGMKHAFLEEGGVELGGNQWRYF